MTISTVASQSTTNQLIADTIIKQISEDQEVAVQVLSMFLGQPRANTPEVVYFSAKVRGQLIQVTIKPTSASVSVSNKNGGTNKAMAR